MENLDSNTILDLNRAWLSSFQTLSTIKQNQELHESNLNKSGLSFCARKSNSIRSQFRRGRNSKMPLALFMEGLSTFFIELVMVCVPIAVKQSAVYPAKCRPELKNLQAFIGKSFSYSWGDSGKDKWLHALPLSTDQKQAQRCVLFRVTKEGW